MKNITRAQRKKLHRTFKVDDLVTWGGGLYDCRVLEVQQNGLIVDATAQGFPRHFVAFDHNVRNGTRHAEGSRGPLRKVTNL